MKKKQGSYDRADKAIKYLHRNNLMSRLEIFIGDRNFYEFKGIREVHNSFLDKIIKMYPIISKEYLYEGSGGIDSGFKYSNRLINAMKGLEVDPKDRVVKKVLSKRYQLTPGPIMDRICSKYNINKDYLLTGKGRMTVSSSKFNSIIKENELIIEELIDIGFPEADCIDKVTGSMSSDINGGGFNLHIIVKRCSDNSIEIYYYSYINYELYGLKVVKNKEIVTKFWKS